MSLTYIRIDLLRQLRDLSNLTFIVAMPVVMYLVFGATAEYGGERAGNGNVQFYVMSSMAVYGAAMAATSVTGTAKMEQILGWGRHQPGCGGDEGGGGARDHQLHDPRDLHRGSSYGRGG
jgi:ABC-2 type transport system permease protein